MNRRGFKIREKAAGRKLDPMLLGMLFFACLVALRATTAHSAPLSESSSLEYKLWTASDTQLFGLEQKIVRNIQMKPRSSFDHYLLSYLFIRRFSESPADLALLRKASVLAQQAIELEPRSEYGYIALAEILDIMGQSDKAIQLLDESTSFQKGWRSNFMRARIGSDKEDATSTLFRLRQALRVKGVVQSIVVPYVVAILQSEHEPMELVEILTKWNREFPHPAFLQSIAIGLSEAKQYDQASKIYDKLEKVHETSVHAKLNNGILLYEHLNNPKKALRNFTDVLSQQQDRLSEGEVSVVNTHLGNLYLKTGDESLAADAYTKAIIASESQIETLDYITRKYRDRSMYPGLVKLIDQINNEIPGNALFHALMGEILSENMAEHQKALLAYSNAIMLEPDRSDFYNGMGLTYYRMNELSKALSLFTSALKVDPSDATARYNEACIFARLGHKERALTSLYEAVNLDPRLQLTAQNDTDFSDIRELDAFQKIINSRSSPQNTSFGH